MSKIAVVGTGAIGLSYGARLQAMKRHEVAFCARTPFGGRLVADGPKGARFEAAVRELTSPDGFGPVDWILLCVKAHQTAGTAPWLKALVGPGTRVAVFQNGVEQRERVAPLAGPAEVMPTVVHCPSWRTAPGVVETPTLIKLRAQDDEAGRGLRELFEGTDVEVILTDDFQTATWSKLCVNIGTGTVTALTGRKLGLIRQPEVGAVALSLIREAVAVARAEGAKLPEDHAEKVVAQLQAANPEQIPSILSDRLAGRPLEADCQNGAVVRMGEKHGIPTPFNRFVLALLGAINTGD